MKPIETILAKSLEGWDGEYASHPVMDIVNTLVRDGRFDETTQVLNTFFQNLRSPQLNRFVLARIAPKILNEYVYKQSGLNPNVIDKLWTEDSVAQTIKDCALKDGALAKVVDSFVSKAQSLSEKI
ncbi:hypothetical protein [Pseudomonas putida]|uniref:hypothetical protein n=1 Tax=Pseudomonas putida TaxID=303 RepID=UPI001CD55B3F|nr:hypothetical protein [Pseudomonas putida]